MPDQSYPTSSFLAGIATISLDIQVRQFAELVPVEMVRAAVATALQRQGVATVGIEEPSHARLSCRVSIMCAMKDSGGRPLSFAFMVQMELFTTGAGLPSNELVIIWNNGAHGLIDAWSLTSSIRSTVSDFADLCGTRIVEAKAGSGA